MDRAFRRRWISPCAFALVIGLLSASNSLSWSQSPAGGSYFDDARLTFCFQGKGSSLPYDAGVLDVAYRRIPALRNQQVVVAGNSSGSIMAVYFSCFGFTDASVDHATSQLLDGNKEVVQNMENPAAKTAKLLSGQRTELPHSALREYIAFALGVPNWRDARSIDEIASRSRARPKFPVLIVAANREVLDNQDPSDQLVALDYKVVDPHTLDVSWKPDVYEFYKRHPERFAREHPNLKLGDDPRIGKALTYFVDASMFELLSQIPPEERLADLRLMTTAKDLALAIMASVSEPTYFDPVVEPDPSKLHLAHELGDLRLSHQRSYYGGYLMPMMGQDIRRMLPGVRVLGTGWARMPMHAQQMLKIWLLADAQRLGQYQSWWADMEINPELTIQKQLTARKLTSQQEYELGQRRAEHCFDRDQGLPPFVERPKFCYPASAAILPERLEDVLDTTDGEIPRLKTLRGLGPLLEPQARP